jgi:hypothetical protein
MGECRDASTRHTLRRERVEDRLGSIAGEAPVQLLRAVDAREAVDDDVGLGGRRRPGPREGPDRPPLRFRERGVGQPEFELES